MTLRTKGKRQNKECHCEGAVGDRGNLKRLSKKGIFKGEKTMKKLLIGLLFFCATFFAVACSDTNEGEKGVKYTVTFRQEGGADKVYEIEEGGSFTEALPALTPKTGYTAAWESVDYTDIRTDLLVQAVYTPNEYVITYESGMPANYERVYGYTIDGATQTVVFDSDVVLRTPTAGELGFLGWKIKDTTDFFTSGKYTVANHITLVAVWDREWSDRV